MITVLLLAKKVFIRTGETSTERYVSDMSTLLYPFAFPRDTSAWEVDS